VPSLSAEEPWPAQVPVASRLSCRRICRVCRGETRAGTDETHFGEYDINPSYPNLAPYVPLTYALTLHACLRDHHRERPTFAQVIALLEGVQQEVASGEYVDLSGAKRVCVPLQTAELLHTTTLPICAEPMLW
jgi:hypothetical protein